MVGGGMLHRFLVALAIGFLGVLAFQSPALATPADDAQTAWRLLDYLAVDYGGAVRDGKVVSAPEYSEMREFSASVSERIAALPDNPSRKQLIAQSRSFQALVERKASPQQVSQAARALGADLLRAYPVPLGPRQTPDIARGAMLFAQNCASCHGSQGDAKTAIARQLDPPPIAFSDRSRASQRSPFAL